MLKLLLFVVIMATMFASARRAYKWAEEKKTTVPPFQIGGLVFCKVGIILSILVVLLDKMGLYPR